MTIDIAELLEQVERLREQTSQAWCDTECPNRRGDIAVLLETQKRLAESQRTVELYRAHRCPNPIDELVKLRKLVEDIDKSFLLTHHPTYCSCMWKSDVACDCSLLDLQQRINEALEAP